MADEFWKVQVVGDVPSTQDLVIAAGQAGEAEGLCIQAMMQSKGRGRHGNTWTAPMGNLYISKLLRPACRADKVGQMAFVAAVALSRAMDEVMDPAHDKKLKWPNDVLIDGKKASGILLDSSLGTDGKVEYLVIGTGVNILAPPEGAIGLGSVKKDDVRLAIHPFRDIYLEKLEESYISWKRDGFAPIREEWIKQAHGLGEEIRIRLPEVTYHGTFDGLDDNGGLQATVDGKKRIFTAGEVHFGVK